MKMWEVQFYELLHDFEDLFPRRSQSGGVRALVEGIDNNVKWTLSWNIDHLLETLEKYVLAWLS
jgi:hypothetical protein